LLNGAHRRVKFTIGLRNPDGHVSEIRASLPAALVLPPSISSRGTAPFLDDSTVNYISYLEANGDALPSYESRVYDRLWDGVSYAGLDPSALNTPTVMSRRTSFENLNDLDNSATPNPGELEAGLRQAMQERNRAPPRRTSSDSLSVHGSDRPASRFNTPPLIIQNHSSPSLNSLSDSTDGENSRVTPISSPGSQHLSPTTSIDSLHADPSGFALPEPYIDVKRLSRVPSYNTANSATAFNLDAAGNGLPTYAQTLAVIPEATSRSRSASVASSILRTPEEEVSQVPLNSETLENGNTMSQIPTNVQAGGAFGSPKQFDDPMKRIGLIRGLFPLR
jgi:hypothetical protein